MRLLNVRIGEKVRVVSYDNQTRSIETLRRFGMVPGDNACMIRHNPLGGLLLVEVEGHPVTLGRSAAARIVVERDIIDSN